MSDLSGQIVVNYQLTALLTEDRLGVLYKATDTRNKAETWLRLLHPELSQGSFQQQFLKHAKRLSALVHPGVVRVLDADYRDSHLYLAMQLMSEVRLDAYLKQELAAAQVLDDKLSASIAKQLAEALHYAHQQGIEHLALSPNTILIASAGSNMSVAKIFDFGFMPLLDIYGPTGGLEARFDPTALRYLAPEQCTSGKQDGRTDIYALGCILYELFVGRPPFAPQNLKEATRMHTQEPAPRPSTQRLNFNLELEKIIMRCLAKDPLGRYQNAGEVARAFSDLENTPPPPPPPVIAPPPAPVSDRLVITTNGSMVQSVEMNASSIVIGRKLEGKSLADVVLEGAKISRQHARIERLADGNYQITDLGADNGTWINEVRLEPNRPQPLTPGTKVRINVYEVVIQRGAPTVEQPPAHRELPGGATRLETIPAVPVTAAPPPVVAAPLPPRPAPPPTAQSVPTVAVPPEPAPSDGYAEISKVEVKINPSVLEVIPGTPYTFSAEINNKSELVDHFPFEAVDLPPEWLVIPQPLNLMPGQQERGVFSLNVPQLPSSTAGTRAFQVRTKGTNHFKEYAVGHGQLMIMPFPGFEAALHPEFLRVGSHTRLEITNTGNFADTYQLSGKDREDALRFDFGPETFVKAGAGETISRVVRVRPKNRPIIGMGRSMEFTISAKTTSVKDSRDFRGGIIIWPYIPLPLLLLLALLLGLLAMWDYDQDGLSNINELKSVVSAGCHTDLFQKDTDNDGFPDGMEIATDLPSACTPAPSTPGPTSAFQSGTPACKDAPPKSPLVDDETGKPFEKGRVLAEGVPNRIRTGYKTVDGRTVIDDEVIESVNNGDEFTIMDSIPVCAYIGELELRWWKVAHNSNIGWMADARSATDTMVEGVKPVPTGP